MAQNVFEDLGFAPEEAKDLYLRAKAMRLIQVHIESQNYSQKRVAEISGLSQSDVSNLLNSKIERFSIDRLLRIAESFDAEITLDFKFPAAGPTS